MFSEEIIAITLGDLIVELTEDTARYGQNESDRYKVVPFTLRRLLNKSGPAPEVSNIGSNRLASAQIRRRHQ